MDRFHVSATGRAVNYLPEYVACELGYFRDVDLEVTAEVPQPWTKVLDHINAGAAQAALGGVWVPLMYRARVRDYFAFAQVSGRCPMAIVHRNSGKPFRWDSLYDNVVLVTGGNGSSPFLYLSGLLYRAGVEAARIRFVHDLSTPMLAELFVGGMGDALVVDAVTAERVTRAHKGVGYLSFAEAGGPVPWSVYYSVPELLDRGDDLAGRFAAGLARGMAWVQEHDGDDARDVVRKCWPDADPGIVVDVINLFRRHGMWDRGARIGEDALHGWQDVIARAGFIDRPTAYDEIVDPRPFASARRQFAELVAG